MSVRFLKVVVSKVVDGPAVFVGSGLCRCEPGTGHKFGPNVFGVAGECPILPMLGQADDIISRFPGGVGHVRIEAGGIRQLQSHLQHFELVLRDRWRGPGLP